MIIERLHSLKAMIASQVIENGGLIKFSSVIIGACHPIIDAIVFSLRDIYGYTRILPSSRII